MASTALPHTTQETLQRQYMAASPPSEAPAPPTPSHHQGDAGGAPPLSPPPTAPADRGSDPSAERGIPSSDALMAFRNHPGPDPYQYTEASVTSGSNSGEEDDRVDLSNNKRLGGHLNGFSSKKRRKQSKPIRLGSGGEQDDQPSQSGQDQGRDEDEEGLVNSTTPELEDGERRPLLIPGLPADLPLNLSAAAAAVASHPTLRVLGAELMQNPDKLPPSAASLYQSMLAGGAGAGNPFGLPPFPFPFPTSRGPPTSLSSGTTPVNSGGRPQIFNPEAYCELCNKEFCNKYFLKTHKANKHGIYSEGIPMSGSPPITSSPSNGPQVSSSEAGSMMTPERPLPPTSQSSQGPPTPNSQAGSPFSGAFIAANMGALRPPFVPLSPGASPSPKNDGRAPGPPGGLQGPGGDPRDQLRDAPSRESTSADSPNGIRSQPPPPSLMSPTGLPTGPPGGGPPIPDFRQTAEERERLMQPTSGGLKENGELRKSLESPQRAPSTTSTPSGLPPHLNFNPLMFGGLPSLDCLRKEDLEAAAAAAAAAAAGLSGVKRPPFPNIPNVPNVSLPSSMPGGPGGSPGLPPKGPFTPEKLRQMGVINADAFCEICCKEFCNKYFLRVHKLKKHGICSPDLPPEKVQKILNQMAKEAGKTGNPPPPIVRPPMTPGGSPFGPGGPGGPMSPDKRLPGGPPPMSPLGMPVGMPLRPPGLMALPPLEPLLPQALKDFKGQMPPPNFDNGPNPFSRPNLPGLIPAPPGTPNKDPQQEIIRINDDSEDERIKEAGIQRGEMAMEDRENGDLEMGAENGEGSDEDGELRQKPSVDLQRLQSMIMELNSGKQMMSNKEENTICKVCNKDMENKYFLRAHMMNEHGVLEDPSSAAASAEAAAVAAASKDMEQQPRQPPPPPLLNGLDMANAQDFAAKFLQQMQKGFGAAGLPPLEGDERSFLERVKSELAAAGAGSPLGPPGGVPSGPLGSPSPTGNKKRYENDPNKKPASLSRSYCDICKKELCNKYFMKTHMLKMHGINIEATNAAGVNCHICNKELCSKYFLKVHMQNSHGLMEDGSPIPPHLKENGSGLFPGIFPPLGPPPAELLGLSPAAAAAMAVGAGSPTPVGDKEHYFSRLLGEQSEMSKEKLERQQKMLEEVGREGSNGINGGHTCSLCGEGFPEIVALQVHIIKSHGAFPPDSNLFGNLEAHKLPTMPPLMGNSEASGGKDSPGSSTEAGGMNKNASSGSEDKSEGEVTPNKAPSTPALGLPPPLTPTSGSGPGGPDMPNLTLNKQFPNIEMLQRHMLSQQFPGLINPLLSGFPGFPGGPPPLGFPNPLQQLLAGNNNNNGGNGPLSGPMGMNGEPLKGQDAASSNNPEDQSKISKGKKRRFKCSKCQLKFKKREECLRHIHAQHNPNNSHNKKLVNSILQHASSPSKVRKNHHLRSQYVKRLMEILRVPTSRGTPSQEGVDHIMQAFLIKNEEPADGVEQKNNDFVPSMVYLPVAKKINQPMTVAFSLTPA